MQLLQYDFSFGLLVLSTMMMGGLLFAVLKMRNKSQLHRAFIAIIAMSLIWCLGHVFEVVTTIAAGGISQMNMWVYVYYFGLIFLPITILFLGMVFVKGTIKFSWKYALLFIAPVVDYVLLVTNGFNGQLGQYFIQYSIFRTGNKLGPLFDIHVITSYGYLVYGLFLLVKFSIKNAGFFSKQSLLIVAGCILPLLMNVVLTLGVVDLPVYYTPISFAFMIVCWAFAILRFDFLNIVPIALQRIVDLISDSYLIVNEDYGIVDYNKTFMDTFNDIVTVRRKDNLLDIVKNNADLNLEKAHLVDVNNKAIAEKSTEAFEVNMHYPKGEKYFVVEITPIFSNDTYSGSIILLKDITQSKRDLETIKANQAIIMEQERLASLGQLIGGVAHNLKTPIMSISGGMEGLKDLAEEYKNSIGNQDVTPEDHQQIAEEMLNWLGKMKSHCAYMSDIITTVKGQAVQFNTDTLLSFTLDELIKRAKLLMKHELSKFHCTLKTKMEVDKNIEIKGEVNSLVQIFDNIILNAIQAYDGESGVIELNVQRSEANILFSFKDFAKGMSQSVKEKLFKQMITTKGSGGTGLGLYMSAATIRGRFGGDMWVASEEGKGTTFYISIPYNKTLADKEEAV